ncbi:MAG: OmpH family outer membrane protein [Parasphingopyxis sp.]|uniref:OmpH family outer membrane protein n=1 Tax=Parasphingopyxis sp. TaxID=1920299 RepID=UPI003FA095E2
MFSKTKTLFAGLLLALPMVAATPAHAQARGVGVVSVDAAIQQTTAYQAAATQIQSTYAAQIQQAQTRATALEAELRPLQQAAQAAQQANPETAGPSIEAFNTRQQAAQQELATIRRPVLLATQYVREQIAVHFNEALTAAMSASNVDLVLEPNAVATLAPNSTANITSAVTTQLNTRVPSVQAIPPAGWNPGDTLRAAQQAAQPAPSQPEGR